MALLSKVSVRNTVIILSVVLSFGLLYLLCFKAIPEGNKEVVIALVASTVGIAVGAIYGYLFGMSKVQGTVKPQE